MTESTGTGPVADPGAPGWHDLPENVRTFVISVAARAVGAVPPEQLPGALLPVARFTPAKRARRGAAPLARALERDAGFRALVAQYLPDGSRLDAGSPPGADRRSPSAHSDPVAEAARVFLLHLPDTGALAAAAGADELASLRARVAELTDSVDRLTARLAQSSQRPARPASSGADPEAADSVRGDARAEAERLRRRLREQGSRVKAAEQSAAAAAAEARARCEEAEARAAREQATAENWRARAEREAQRAERANQALDRLRDRAGQQRADTDRRLELLLDALQQAAEGLRREWRLTSGGADPAEVVARGLPEVDRARRRSVDPALLLDWLALPAAHLIVDGYNVTKTGYPELSLADQRDRLIRALGALAARTGAEMTVVFDGAAVVAAPSAVRGVRVTFSPPGVIADDVVRQLAAAEPAGRVVVVVSSDREVVDGVRRSGARTAPSAVLLALLG